MSTAWNKRLALCVEDIGISWTEAAEILGVHRTTVMRAARELRASGERPTEADRREFERLVARFREKKVEETRQISEQIRFETTGDRATVEVPRGRISSVEELLAKANVDLSEWEVERQVINKWEQASGAGDNVTVTELFQIKVWLRKKVRVELPAPVVLKISRPRTPRRSAPTRFTSVHYSDAHVPYHDPRAINILYQILDITQANLVVDHGDAIDCAEISRYEKNPYARVSLREELEMVARHHGTVHAITPHAEHRWYLGNHEDRLRRLIWSLADDRKAGEILTLPSVREALDLSALTGVDKLGWRVVEYPRHDVLFDRLIVTHGEVVRSSSGESARAEYRKYGKSGMSGHTHRRGVYEHRDYNGFHAWWELGCLCLIRDDYVSFPDWQQGFAVVTWSDDRSEFAVEEIRIHDGKAWFRGKLLTGDSRLFGDLAA